MELLNQAFINSAKTAVYCSGRIMTYANLLTNANVVSERLLIKRKSLNGERVALIIPPCYEYIACKYGI